MSPPFGRRYWSLLTGASVAPAAPGSGRGWAVYQFWQRYWAAFTGVILPLPAEPAADPVRVDWHARSQPLVSGSGAGWYALSPLPVLAGLRAGDEQDLIKELVLPDARAEYFVRRTTSIPPRYRVEVVVRDRDVLPAMVSLRYDTPDGDQEILVPVGAQEAGPAASQVELPRFEGSGPLEASAPSPVVPAAVWDGEIVAVSVRAAVTEATRNAWRQVREIVSDPLRQIISRALQ